MSRLKISDLSFCENELPSDSQVQGGLGIIFRNSLIGRRKVSFYNASSAEYNTDYTQKADNYRHVVTDDLGRVVGGWESGTLDDGTKYSRTFSRAST